MNQTLPLFYNFINNKRLIIKLANIIEPQEPNERLTFTLNELFHDLLIIIGAFSLF